MKRTRPIPIVDIILPGRRVHLIGGASGSGKTTWLMQMIEEWRESRPVCGFPSFPGPFVYLSYDRDDDDFYDTCERLSIDPATYTFHSPHGAELDIPLLKYLALLQQKHPETRLYIIEGIAMQTPEGKINDQRVVGKWLRQLQEFCKTHDVTIIGVLHSAKTKERDRYKEPRARIAGCGAWAGYSSTVVIVEEKEADGTSELRDVLILPRNARKLKITYDFENGRMVESKIRKPSNALPRFVAWLYTLQPGEEFTTAEAKTATNLADSNLHGDLERAMKPPTQLIEKIGHGQYRVLLNKQHN